MNKLAEGYFVSEALSRFKGTISINGQDCTCYIPFSSKLSKHLTLFKNPVLLTERTSPAGLKLDLYAIKAGDHWCFLDLRQITALIGPKLPGKVSLKRELLVERKLLPGFRADFASYRSRTVWEVKTILGEGTSLVYPAMQLDRATRQLADLWTLQNEGWAVHLVFVALNPAIRTIRLSETYPRFEEAFKRLQSGGMKVSLFSISLTGVESDPLVRRERLRLLDSRGRSALLDQNRR